jgi:hypothetical protein
MYSTVKQVNHFFGGIFQLFEYEVCLSEGEKDYGSMVQTYLSCFGAEK